jgi:hypothetical protein
MNGQFVGVIHHGDDFRLKMRAGPGLETSTIHRDAVNAVADLRISGAGRGYAANSYV